MIHIDNELVVCCLILLAEILTIVFVVLVSRAPFRTIARLVRGRSRKKVSHAASEDESELNPTPDLKGQLGLGAFASIRRAFRPYTETDNALLSVDPGFARDDGKSETYHDFANDEEKHLHRRGTLFRWIYVKPGYMSDIVQMTDEVVQVYYKAAQRFFRHQVRIASSAKIAYEDDEGAIAVKLFRVRDRNCYYLMNEMRRVINDNVRKLAFTTTAVLLSVLVLAVFLPPEYKQHRIIEPITSVAGIVGKGAQWWHRGLFGIVLCVSGGFLLWLLQRVEYVPYQRNNGNELRNFLSRYLSRASPTGITPQSPLRVALPRVSRRMVRSYRPRPAGGTR